MDRPAAQSINSDSGVNQKHPCGLELIFTRPVRVSLPWGYIEALFQKLAGDVNERFTAWSSWFCYAKSGSSIDTTHRLNQTSELLLQPSSG
jgi:hypothetical protein